jgi:hypothetical protein
MKTIEPPVRTQRDVKDDVTFQEAMAAHLRQSPWVFVSALAHAAVLLLLWALAPPRQPLPAQLQVTLQDIETVEVVQPREPEEPDVEPEPEPVVTPLTDAVVTDDTPEAEASSDFDSAATDAESAQLSDQWNTAVGLLGGTAGPYSKRGNGGEGGPGGRRSPVSVQRGLQWLAAHQDPDGRWDADGFMKHDDPQQPPCDGPGNPVHDVGCTALALLAFLGENNTTKSGPYRDVVRRGVGWLRRQQDMDTGLFGARLSHDYIYDHAIAAYAMCEAYGLSRSKLLEKHAQRGLDRLEAHRNAYGVWRYQPRDQDNDISVTAWAVMAYEAGRFFGLQVNRAALDNAEAFLDQVSDASGRHGYRAAGEASSRKPGDHGVRFPAAKTAALTGVGLFCRFFLGQDPAERPVMKAAARLLAASPPQWDEEGGAVDHYGWYYGTYALFQMGGPQWRTWRRAVEAAVPANQHQDQGAPNLYGSWDPCGPWGEDGGRVYSTAILTLTMQASYRYTPLIR